MNKNFEIIYMNKEIFINVIGISKKQFKISIDGEQVYNNKLRVSANPVNQIIFYYEKMKYYVYFIFDYSFARRPNYIIMINDSVCYGDKERLKRIVEKNRTLVKSSKYYNKKNVLFRVLLYGFLNGITYAILMQLFQFIENNNMYVRFFLFHFLFFGIGMGLFGLSRYKNMDLNGIDEIDLSHI